MNSPSSCKYPYLGVAVVVSVADGSRVSVGDGGVVAVGDGTSVVATKLAVADGGIDVEVGEAGSKVKVGEAVQVGVFTEDVLVGTFGTLIGFPEAMKVELPRQFARCKSATVTR